MTVKTLTATVYPATNMQTADVVSAEGALCVGCEVADGKIIPALCACDITANAFTDVKTAGYSAAAGVYFVCADKKGYYSADGLAFYELAELEGDEPFIFEQRENGIAKLYAAGEGTCVCFGSGSGASNTFDCGIFGGQFKSGRLFGIDITDNFKLRWSGEGGAFDWEESIDGAGWLKLDGAGGRILNLLCYGEKLVAVRENCLSVISAFGTPENFKAENKNLYIAGVCKNTAAVAGNKLLFFAVNGAYSGLYSYNGAKITRVNCPLAEDIALPVCAVADGDLYFLSGYVKPLERRAVLVYNANSGFAYFADFPASALTAGKGGVYAYADGTACKLERGGEFTYKSGEINFGSAEAKYLHAVKIGCDGGSDIEVGNGSAVRAFKDVKNALRADMRGVNFTFTVKSRAKITALQAVAEVANGI